MKLSLTLAFFTGAIQAENLKEIIGDPIWSLKSVNDHRTDSQVQHAYGEHSTRQANGRPPYKTAALLRDQSDSESDSDEEQE